MPSKNPYTRKKPYNKTVSYIVTVNGEYFGEKSSLAEAKRFAKTELCSVNLSSKIHVIKQVVTETVMDELEYTMKPILNSTSLDEGL